MTRDLSLVCLKAPASWPSSRGGIARLDTSLAALHHLEAIALGELNSQSLWQNIAQIKIEIMILSGASCSVFRFTKMSCFNRSVQPLMTKRR